MTDEQNQPVPEVVAAVAESNAQVAASLSTSMSAAQEAHAMSGESSIGPAVASDSTLTQAIGDAPSAGSANPTSTNMESRVSDSSVIADTTPATNDAPEIAQLGDFPSSATLAPRQTSVGSLNGSTDASTPVNLGSASENGAVFGDQGIAKTAHHTALEDLVGAIRRTFNLLGGDLEAAVQKAEDLL